MDSLAQMINPTCTILTNIGNAHIHTLKDLKNTAEEKVKLLYKTPKTNWSLIPKDPLINPHVSSLIQQIHYWNEAHHHLPHAIRTSQELTSKMPYRVTFPDDSHFDGVMTSGFSYFLDLVNMAVKAAWLLKVPSHAIINALKNHIPEHMRTEIWKAPTGTTFINNTYCSDPQSVDLALKHLDETPEQSRQVFVFGGMREDKEHHQNAYRLIGKAICRANINLLILYDNHDFAPLIEEVSENSLTTEIVLCSSYQEALIQMRSRIKHDDIVLIKGAKKESLDRLVEVFNDSISNNQCLINLAAIRENIEALRNRLSPGVRIMAIVKALAYGTDNVRIAKFLNTCGIDILGVSYVEEGVSLRREGVNQAIFVINAAPYEAVKAIKWDLEIGASDHQLIEALAHEAARKGKICKVHLHIDTGMSRFGCRPEEALDLAKSILSYPSLSFEGVMTHFACAENPNQDEFTLAQVARFDAVISQLKAHGLNPSWQHAANSSATIRFQLPQYNMVRIGLAIYGLYSTEDEKKALELRLALSLTSRIVGINVCKIGETISYGRSFTITRDNQRIAVLPIGYFDGLHRNYSGKGQVIIRGQKAPMVGRICMDFMMVDVTDILNVAVGDTVLIFGVDEHGQYLSPEDLASKGNSIAHELVTCLGPRIQRVFMSEL